MTASEIGLDNIMKIIKSNKMLGERELKLIERAIKTYGDLRVCERICVEIERPDNVVQFSDRARLKNLLFHAE